MAEVYEFTEKKTGWLYEKIGWRGPLDSETLKLCGLELVGTGNNGFSGYVIRRKTYDKTT